MLFAVCCLNVDGLVLGGGVSAHVMASLTNANNLKIIESH